MNKLANIILFSFTLIFFTSCAGTSAKFTTNKLSSSSNKPRLLIFPMDINLFEIAMGGATELKAEWTEQGKKNIANGLREIFNDKNVELIFYNEGNEPGDLSTQTFKLLNMVGSAIYTHYYIPYRNLPTKKDFSWSIGQTTSPLKDKFQADYALYIGISDTYSTGARVALGIVTGILIGYVPPSGLQIGRAYLVDLKNGDIVWFNQLVQGSFGDIREMETAKRKSSWANHEY